MNKDAKMLGIGSWRATAMKREKWEKLLKQGNILHVS
jgi:hypothetical protein